MTRYYLVHDRAPLPMDRWFLHRPVDARGVPVNLSKVERGVRVDIPEPLTFQLRVPGDYRDFTMVPMEVPLVEERFGDRIAAIAAGDVQLLSARIQDLPHRFTVLRILSYVDCIDHARSETLGGPQTGYVKFRVDPQRAEGHEIFRIVDWPAPVIVSEKVREALVGASGATFVPV